MFRILCLLIIIDISGDYIFFPKSDLVFLVSNFIRYVTILIIFLIYIDFYFFKFNSKVLFKIDKILIILLIIFTYGFFRGLYNNSLLINCLNEILPYSMLLLIPILINKKTQLLEKDILFFYDFLLYILIFKIIICQYNHYITYSFFSWKILLKMSVIYIAPFYYFTIKYMKEKECIYLIKSLVFLIGILIANSRSLILLITSLFIYILFFKKVSNKLFLFLLILAASLISSFITDIDYFHIFGFWDNSAFQNTVSYRFIQFNILIDRFIEHPIIGYGFGFFNAEYETYAELNKPYLLELDLINFGSKIGLPLFIIYIIIYFKLFYKIIFKYNFNSSLLYESVAINLLCLFIYSFTQTGHSSYTYWFLFSLFYTLYKKYNHV